MDGRFQTRPSGEARMRWAQALRRGSLIVALLLVGYADAGALSAETAGSRGPITLATGRDLTGYLQHVLDGWNSTHPGERATLVQLPEAADEVHAQMADSLRSGSDRFDVL